MEAMLLVGGNSLGPMTTLMHIDFSLAALGSTEVVDQTGNYTFTKTGAATPQVVEHELLGRAMKFPSGSFFTTGKVVDLSTGTALVEVEFTSDTSASPQVVWATGDYASISQVVGGVSHVAVLAYGHQIFTTTDDRKYMRCPIAQQPVKENIKIAILFESGKKQVTIENKNTGLVQRYPVTDWFGPGKNFSLGGSYVNSFGSFVGAIKSLKVSKVGG